MKPMQIIGANAKLSTHNGDDVWGMIDSNSDLTTCWTPSAEELENLKSGGYVKFTVGFGNSLISADCIHPFPPD